MGLALPGKRFPKWKSKMEVKELGLGAQLSCTIMGNVALLCTGAQWTEGGVPECSRRTVSNPSHMPVPRSAALADRDASLLTDAEEDRASGLPP